MFKIEFISKFDPYDDWEILDGVKYYDRAEAEEMISQNEEEDLEKGFDFVYRIVEV
jgi:hypothetical protein